jgi:hypothetical protein
VAPTGTAEVRSRASDGPITSAIPRIRHARSTVRVNAWVTTDVVLPFPNVALKVTGWTPAVGGDAGDGGDAVAVVDEPEER